MLSYLGKEESINKMEKTVLGILAGLISTASWAFCSVIFKRIGRKIEPVLLTWVKAAIGGILLLIFTLLIGKSLVVDARSAVLLAASGVLGITIGDILYFNSLNKLSPMTISIILFVAPDLFNGLFGYFFLGEIPTVKTLVAMIFVLAGLAFFVFNKEKQSSRKIKNSILGVILAIFSLMCTSYSMVIVKPVLQTVSPLVATTYRMLFGALALTFVAIFSNKKPEWKEALSDKTYNLKFFIIIAIVTFGGFLPGLIAISKCHLIVASIIMSFEPLFVFIFMIMFYRHKPRIKEFIGLIFALIGLMLICI